MVEREFGIIELDVHFCLHGLYDRVSEVKILV